MVRQMFMRMILFIRGFDKVVEHGFQINAHYVFNETDDYFSIGSNWSKYNKDISSPLFVVGKFIIIIIINLLLLLLLLILRLLLGSERRKSSK